MTIVDPGVARQLARTARLSGGSALSYCSTEWGIAGSCESPVSIELRGRNYAGHRIEQLRETDTRYGLDCNKSVPHWIDMHVPCFQCRSCRKFREHMWRARARTESEFAIRTWFLTHTLTPANHEALMLETEVRLLRGGTRFHQLGHTDQFGEVCKTMHAHAQLAMKRIRKASGAPLRYLWVYEETKRGVPHAHVLLHEQDPTKPVRKQLIERNWRLGFTHARLSNDPKAADYVTKYITKTLLAPRASRHYGQPLRGRLTDTVSTNRDDKSRDKELTQKREISLTSSQQDEQLARALRGEEIPDLPY